MGESFTEFWEQCLALARTFVGQLMLRVEVTGNRVNFGGKGLKVSRKCRNYMPLDQLPQEPNAGTGF